MMVDDQHHVFVSRKALLAFPEGAALLWGYLQTESGSMGQDYANGASGYYEEGKKCGEIPWSDPNPDYYERLLKLAKKGWFQISIDKIRRDIGMSQDRQHKYLSLLKQKGLVKTERRGLPATRWIWISK